MDYTYRRQAYAWLASEIDEIVIVPDQVYEDQRAWDKAGNNPFPALRRKNGKHISVRIDGDAYKLHTSGTGDMIVKLA